MNTIINYFSNEIYNYKEELKVTESDIKSKKIVITEVQKTIERLTDTENNTFNVFSANGNRQEFHNKEVLHLKSQEETLETEIQNLQTKVESINSKILTLQQLLETAKNVTMLDNGDELADNCDENFDSNDVFNINDNTFMLQFLENLVSDLRNISGRLEFASKVSKNDFDRSKMETGLARMKILQYIQQIDEILNNK